MNKKHSIWSNYKYVISTFYKTDKSLFVKIFIYLVTGTLVPLGGALLPAFIIRLIEQGISWQNLLLVCIGSFIIYGAANYLYQNTKTTHYMGTLLARINSFDSRLNLKTFEMDYQSFESHEMKQKMEKAVMALYYGDYNGISGFVLYGVMALESILGLLVYVLLIGTLNFWIVLLLFGLSLIRFVCLSYAKKYEEKNKSEKAKISLVQDYLSNQSQEIQSGKDVRLYQLYHWLSGLYKRKNQEYTMIQSKEKGRYFMCDLVGLVLDLIRDAVCYSYIFTMISQGMSVSALIFYINMVRGFGSWMDKISVNVTQVVRNNVIVSDYREYVDYERPSLVEVKPTDALNQPWRIEFKDVCFSYEGSDRLILDHLNLVIEENQKVAIVGLNGAGKTTLIKLVCGLYHPTSGQILINGVDIESIDREQLFSHISAIFQDTFLLSFSIQENITVCDRSEVDEKKYEDVLKKSGLYDKVMSLKNKDDTFINKDLSQDGVALSGGQIQKALFARALYKPSHLLILDEPTAALDALAESEMYEKYNQMTENETSIFISHRLASTRFCDRIIYFENGQILEEGTHDQLLEKQGKYAHLYDVQSQYYKEDEGNEEHVEI